MPVAGYAGVKPRRIGWLETIKPPKLLHSPNTQGMGGHIVPRRGDAVLNPVWNVLIGRGSQVVARSVGKRSDQLAMTCWRMSAVKLFVVSVQPDQGAQPVKSPFFHWTMFQFKCAEMPVH